MIESKSMKFDYTKIKTAMRRSGFTQRQFAAEIGIDEATLCKIFKSRYVFNCETIYRVCKVLNIPRGKIGQYFFTPMDGSNA